MRRLLLTAPADAETVGDDPRDPASAGLRVAFLCAQWCTACREFGPVAQRLADAHPDIAMYWVDVEDDAAVVGDIDVENFPTLVIARGDAVLHVGPTLPQEGIVRRLLDEMRRRTEPLATAAPATTSLLQALREA